MRVRRLRLLGILGMAMGFAVLGAADANAGVGGREHRQRDRIEAGIGDGSLTRGEAARLGAEQLRIERMERRFRRNDGRLGPRERLELHRALDRSSRHIHRARHNARER